jgi:hypothetical protein
VPSIILWRKDFFIYHFLCNFGDSIKRKVEKLAMKKITTVAFATAMTFVSLNACTKEAGSNSQQPKARRIDFQLFTTSDFTSDSNLITFTLRIKSADNIIAWDSVLAPMKIKDIPDEAHKLEAIKQVPNDDGMKTLSVGFLYTIENVGMSWWLDTCMAGDTLKQVRYDFK